MASTLPATLVPERRSRGYAEAAAFQAQQKALANHALLMPILGWNKVTEKGLRFVLELSPDVRVLHVAAGEESDELRKNWSHYVENPAAEAGLQQPRLVVLQSPYRFVINPIVDYVLDLGKKNPDRKIAVVIPELVESHWYQYFLHNQRGKWLKALLLLQEHERLIIITVPWYPKV